MSHQAETECGIGSESGRGSGKSFATRFDDNSDGFGSGNTAADGIGGTLGDGFGRGHSDYDYLCISPTPHSGYGCGSETGDGYEDGTGNDRKEPGR